MFIADWDESNAFCNIPRRGAPRLLDGIAPGLAGWCQSFYGALGVRVVTPFGLTDPYPLLQGGGQGDSMGVGLHLAVGIIRTNFHSGILQAGLHPADMTTGTLPISDICFPAPHDPSTFLPELVYSDDRRFFSRSSAGLAHLLDVACHACWAAGGSVNFQKLKVYAVGLSGGKLKYLTGELTGTHGSLSFSSDSLSFLGIPLVDCAQGPPLAFPYSILLWCGQLCIICSICMGVCDDSLLPLGWCSVCGAVMAPLPAPLKMAKMTTHYLRR